MTLDITISDTLNCPRIILKYLWYIMVVISMILTRKWYSFQKSWISFLLPHLLLLPVLFSFLWLSLHPESFSLSLYFLLNNTIESIYNLMMILKLSINYYLSKILRSRVSFQSINCLYMILRMIFHLSISRIRLPIKLSNHISITVPPSSTDRIIIIVKIVLQQYLIESRQSVFFIDATDIIPLFFFCNSSNVEDLYRHLT